MKNRKLAFLSLTVALSVFFCACSPQEIDKPLTTSEISSTVPTYNENEKTTQSEPSSSTPTTTKQNISTSQETTTEILEPTTGYENEEPESPASENINLTEDEKAVFEKTNLLRKSMGLHSYKINYELCKLAREKAENIRDLGYFGHLSPTLGYANDMMNRAGVGYKSAAENLAKGKLVPSSAMLGWFQSKGHREALLNETYKEIGIGVIYGDDGVSYWVQMFIDPK